MIRKLLKMKNRMGAIGLRMDEAQSLRDACKGSERCPHQ